MCVSATPCNPISGSSKNPIRRITTPPCRVTAEISAESFFQSPENPSSNEGSQLSSDLRASKYAHDPAFITLDNSFIESFRSLMTTKNFSPWPFSSIVAMAIGGTPKSTPRFFNIPIIPRCLTRLLSDCHVEFPSNKNISLGVPFRQVTSIAYSIESIKESAEFPSLKHSKTPRDCPGKPSALKMGKSPSLKMLAEDVIRTSLSVVIVLSGRVIEMRTTILGVSFPIVVSASVVPNNYRLGAAAGGRHDELILVPRLRIASLVGIWINGTRLLAYWNSFGSFRFMVRWSWQVVRL